MSRQCWVAEELPGLGCDPTWTTDPQPADTPPTPSDLRQAEISDLRHQGAALTGIYRATTIHAPEYL